MRGEITSPAPANHAACETTNVDGLMYMGYWRDGLVILDVGKGIKGGSPEHPQFVSQLRFNYTKLYGPDISFGP